MCLHYDGISLTDQHEKANQEHYVVKVTAGKFVQTLDVLVANNEEKAKRVSKDYTYAELIADKLIDIIKFYDIADRIKLVSTDTARVNTGAKGITSFLESKFESVFEISIKLIRLNCKHHEFQLLLRHSFEEIFGSTAGAREPFLDRFSDLFNNLDASKIEPCETFDEDKKLELIIFIDSQFQFNTKRADYKEMLTLAKCFLMRTENPKIVKPGKYNHSRFIKQLNVCFMIFLFRKQLPSKSFPFSKIENFCKLALDLYFVQWFQASIPAYTPLNDLNQFKLINDLPSGKLRTRLLKTCKNHLSYVNPPLVSLSFLDHRIPKEHKLLMIQNLSKEPKAFDFDGKTQIYDLINSDCLNFFKTCNLSYDFFNLSIDDWERDEDFNAARNFVKNLHITNDTTEQTVSTCKFIHSVFGVKNLGDIVISTESDRHKHGAPTKQSYSKL